MTDSHGATRIMQQVAPWPDTLESAVAELHFMPDWNFELVDDDARDVDDGGAPIGAGLTLFVYVRHPDAYHPERRRHVLHKKIVPAATFNRPAWERWLLEQCLDILRHEACEFLAFGKGADQRRPFAPTHGPGNDPYTVKELATDQQRRTSFQGIVKAAPARHVDLSGVVNPATTGAPNSGHGHVRARPDGAKARCGGPGLCEQCSREAAQNR